ncbi:FecR domain-containing protein [Sphingopyxis sp. OPL5]|uniref:FecR family protein n=1 Tax=Sphingopyxis sp. OPL5 TaxID=2486273 RepID=UPI00164EB3B2|nr:FecR domain-containing protein [Sphingopyxis sp. OPL5]QNO26251.1 FecR domain-containing protein [Sphingopyxis sp. OPL5]
MGTGSIMDEAIAWHVRLQGPAADGVLWAEFTAWMEADPAHADAYDAVALADDRLSDELAETKAPEKNAPLATNDNEPGVRPWYRRTAFLSIAASLILALCLSPMLLRSPGMEAITTQPGETREIALGDGSTIALNGGTTIHLDRKAERFARLDSGEAIFTIKHDSARPFVVETGDGTLRDLGTIFNVRQSASGLEVGVSEGSVQYDPGVQAVTVTAGRQLRVQRGKSRAVVTAIDPASVGGWRQGRLSYHDASLATIALDLTRSLGTPVTVSPDLASRRFSGVIRIDRDEAKLFRQLESLLGVHARHSAKGWQLTR